MELIIVIVMAFWAGWKISQHFHARAMFYLLKELNVKESDLHKLAIKYGLSVPTKESSESKDELTEIHIKVEQHGSEIYAFRVDNDQFLGQGTDRASLIDHISKRMVNVRLIVDEGTDLLQKNNSQNG